MIRIFFWEITYIIIRGLSEYLFDSPLYRYAKENIKQFYGRMIYRMLLFIVKLEYRCVMKMAACSEDESMKTVKTI